jgi:hypothetical protein
MNAFYPALVLTLALGQSPSTDRPAVLVLDDFKLLEGQVVEIPDFHDATGETKLYRVTSAGEVKTLPAKSVLFLGGTRQEAYRYVKGQWKPASVDGYIKLAEWCRDAGLSAEALAAAKAAAAIQPPDAYLVKLGKELEARAAEDRTVRIVRPAPPKAASPVGVPVAPVSKPVVDPAVEKYFGLKVQPILMNQCVSCHADPKQGTKFVLGRVAEGEATGATTTRNLAAVLAEVSADRPQQSPLLVFAVGPHGGQTQAALSVNHPAYQHLLTWATAAAEGMPKPIAMKSVSFAAAAEPVPPPAPVAVLPAPGPVPAAPPAPIVVSPVAMPAPHTGPPKINITVGNGPVDPFDPAEFNKAAPPVKK